MSRSVGSVMFMVNVVVVALVYRAFGASYFDVRLNSLLLVAIALAMTFLEVLAWDFYFPEADPDVQRRQIRLSMAALALSLAGIMGSAAYLHYVRISTETAERNQAAEDLRNHQQLEQLRPGLEALQKLQEDRAASQPSK